MWIWLILASALLLGFYDVAKKEALKKNSVLYVLFIATAISTLLLVPFMGPGSGNDHLHLVLKAFLVTSSWVSGLVGIKKLPLTTASTIKASRPIFVLIFSLVLFGEKLNWMQWCGIIVAFAALFMLSRSSKKEGIEIKSNSGFVWMAVSVLTGAASALYDKHILASMDPLFVQCWSNVYITVLLGISILIWDVILKKRSEKFKWDWTLLLIAVLITAADFLYFLALSQEGALLSVISIVRRCSVIITFAGGALLFKEHNIRSKALDLAVLLAGIGIIVLGTA